MATEVELNGIRYPVLGLRLTLSLSSAPRLVLRLGEKHPNRESIGTLVAARASGKLFWNNTLVWIDESSPLHLLGFHQSKGGGGIRPLDVHALVLGRDLVKWLESTTPAAEKTASTDAADAQPDQLTIYQRRPTEGDYDFLRGLCGSRLGALANERAVERAFPVWAAICRPVAMDHLAFLVQVTSLLRQRSPEVHGWTLFNDSAAPIRVITSLSDAAGDDCGPEMRSWQVKAPERAMLGWRLAGPHATQALRMSRGFTSENQPELLRNLCSVGVQKLARDQKSVKVADRASLIMTPGPVRLWASKLVCREVTYVFEMGGEKEVQAIASLVLPAELESAAPTLPTCVGVGEFRGWSDAAPADRIRLVAPAGAGWSVMDPKGEASKPDRELFVEAYLPTAFVHDKRKHAGMYVRHQPGDRPTFTASPGETPRSLGGAQVRIDAFEDRKIDLALHAPHIAAITAPNGGDVNAHGCHLNGAATSVYGEKVELLEKSVWTTNGLEVKVDTKIRGNLDVT